MDLKDISWVGDIYEKFEAMCLEVEETVYQDTVKYVENQVEIVGSSMKKFYSDVMQDLVSLPSTDAEKYRDFNSPLNFYGDIGICMKPKIGTMENQTKTDNLNKVTRDQTKTTNCDSDYEIAKEDFTEGDSRGISEESLSSKSNLQTMKSLRRRRLSASCSDVDMKRMYSLIEPSSENLGGNSTEETVTDFFEESGNETGILSEQIVDNATAEQSSDRATSGGDSMVETNDVNTFTNDVAIESCSNWQVKSDEIADGKDFLFSPESSNDWKTESNEIDSSFSSEMELIQQADNTKLEDSCVLVNRDDFHFVPCQEQKSKFYQKKIRDVFSPRKRPSRKHEYEQLKLWPTVEDSNLSLTINEGKISSAADEAEWELL